MKIAKKVRKMFCVLASAFLAFAVTVSLTACDGDLDKVPEPGNPMEGWSDDWGSDDWGDGYAPPSSDPSDYNKIDWTAKYNTLDRGINATTDGKFIPFYPGNGAHIYEAENAVLSGGANTEEDGNYVGSLDNSSVMFQIESEVKCSALVVVAAAVNPDLADGVRFGQQYSLYCNGGIIETDDCWFQGTGSWMTFKENAVGEVNLVDGDNKIEFFSGLSRSNIDYVKLVPTAEDSEKYPSDPQKYLPAFDLTERIEAEKTNLINAQIEGGNIGWTSSDTKMEFAVINPLDVNVERTLYINAAIGLGDDDIGKLSEDINERMALKVNGASISLNGKLETIYSPNGWWSAYHDNEVATVTLKANSTAIFSVVLSDQFNVDYLELKGDPVLTGITVSDMKTIYAVGESVSADDLKVTALYDHGGSRVLESGTYSISHKAFSALSDSCEVTVTFTDGGITRTAKYTVSVTETIQGPTRITIASPIYKTEYAEGAKFSLVSAQVRGDFGSEGWRDLDDVDYSLQYSLTENDGWTDELTFPELNNRQELKREMTVHIRAALSGNSAMNAVTSAPVTVYVQKEYNLISDYILYDKDVAGTVKDGFAPFWPGNGAHRYEAEKGELGGIARSNHWHVGDLRHDDASGDATVTFRINSAATQDVNVLLVASLSVNPSFVPSDGDDEYFTFEELTGNKVAVNGTEVPIEGMVKNTDGWEIFAENAMVIMTLRPGENTITFTFAADATNFEYIKLVPTKADAEKYAADTSKLGAVFELRDRIEAKNTRFVNAEVENDTHLSHTRKTSRIEFVVNNTSIAAVEKTIRFNASVNAKNGWSANAADRLTVTVNGKAVTLDGTLTDTGSTTDWWNEYADSDLAKVTFESGYNVVVITLDEELNPNYLEFI